MAELRSVAAAATPGRRAPASPPARSASPDADRRSSLRRRVDSAGDALSSLASAGDSPSGADRAMAQAFARLERLGIALRRVSEELAVERRRTSALREEVRRLRGEAVQSGRGIQPTG